MSDADDRHLDAATAAELAEHVLPDAQAAGWRRHVRQCAACAEVLDGVAAVPARLATLAREPMPADVAQRVEARLAVARGTAAGDGPLAPSAAERATVVPLETRRRRRAPSAAALSAAAAAVALVGAVAYGVVSGGSTSSGGGGSSASQAAGGAATPRGATFPVAATGHVYTPANVATLARELVHRSSARTSMLAGTASVPPALRGLATDRSALLRCAESLTGSAAQLPQAVDLARFTDPSKHRHAAPALVFVLPGPAAGRTSAWVVGPRCGADLYFFRMLPAG